MDGMCLRAETLGMSNESASFLCHERTVHVHVDFNSSQPEMRPVTGLELE